MSAPGSKPGLERINKLLEALSNPQQNLAAVHIAGTNGKGSTSLMIADIISQAGCRVGRFISPHLHSYRERFTINGREIKAETLKGFLDRVEAVIQRELSADADRPTEFEILTAVAFLYFKEENVDLMVLEVGMGGLYDSTNVIIPLVSVITSIAYDHTAFLGNTIEEIAFNKAGIIKPGVPVVTGRLPESAQQVVCQEAVRQNAPVIPADSIQVRRIQQPDLLGQILTIESRFFHIDSAQFALLGGYQLSNLASALAVVEILMDLGYIVEEKHLLNALAAFRMPGRMEVLQQNPLVIGDVAHNPQGAQALAASLAGLLPQRSKVLMCGFLDDKDVKMNLLALGDHTRLAVVSRPESDRAVHWQEAARIWKEIYPQQSVFTEENIKAAVQKSLSLLEQDEYLLITGSFYLLDGARKCFCMKGSPEKENDL